MKGIKNPSYKHGHACRGEYTKEYTSWCNMRRRCYSKTNNRYYAYGALGVIVCERWNPITGGSFENFILDMGRCPAGATLDRVNNAGNYEPSNCRWATGIEQANNKSNNRFFINKENEVWSLRRWCVILDLDYKSCWSKLFVTGRPPEDVLGVGFKYLDKLH